MFCLQPFNYSVFLFNSTFCLAQDNLPNYLKDRGTGISSSMFGTYINKGEFIFYPHYEFYYDEETEYIPSELGNYGSNEAFEGRFRAHEGLIFLGYGITDRLAIELEAAIITATQHKSDDDPSTMPDKIKESGLGDVEFQLRWRWNKETESRPEIFSYYETVFPLQKDRKLIGTSVWELKFGTGLIKGFAWGTMTSRLTVEYNTEENKAELGEFAIEYLKRVSELFRFFLAVEGTQDEIEFITDFQFHISRNAFIRINNAVGLTPEATDYAPEFGILFRF